MRTSETMFFKCENCSNLFSVKSVHIMSQLNVKCPSCSSTRIDCMTDEEEYDFEIDY